MKKLFISCPMKGRTEEAIRKSMEFMHDYAELVTGEPLEVIESYSEGQVGFAKHPSVLSLGRSIELMADADYVVGIGWSEVYRGCVIEREVAQRYGIPFIQVPYEQCVTFEDAVNYERNCLDPRALTAMSFDSGCQTITPCESHK